LLLKRSANTDSLSYEARPLDGIWAIAPYLHNGSVPGLCQLLLPAKDRMKKFYVGTREFDPLNVGFVTKKRDGAFELDTSLPGNFQYRARHLWQGYAHRRAAPAACRISKDVVRRS
jgi:hypothetical protein